MTVQDAYSATYLNTYGAAPAARIAGAAPGWQAYVSEGAGKWYQDTPAPGTVPPPPSPSPGGGGGGGPAGSPHHGAALSTVRSGDPSIAAWIAAVGRPLDVRHYFAGANTYGSYAASPWSGEAGVRKMLVDFELAHDGSQASALGALLASCKSAGLQMDVTLWHNMPKKGFASPADYATALAPYVPVIRQYGYRHIFDVTAYQATHDNAIPVWYPGDSLVDAIGLEWYAPDYVSYGERLDAAAAFADAHGKPFGLTEYGAEYAGAGGSDTPTSEADGVSFLSYTHSFFAARYANKAIASHYDLLSWNAAVSGSGSTPGYVAANQPASWLDWYRKIYDLVTTGQ